MRPVFQSKLAAHRTSKRSSNDGIIINGGGRMSKESQSTPATPSSSATAATGTDASSDTCVETPFPFSHSGGESADIGRKDLLSSVARVVSPPPLLSPLEDALSKSIDTTGIIPLSCDIDGEDFDDQIGRTSYRHGDGGDGDGDDDDETSTAMRNLSEAFGLAEATIDSEIEAFMDMASLAVFNDDDDDDDEDHSDSITSQGTEEAEISEMERQELEEVDEVAMLLRQNSRRYAYEHASSSANARPSALPLTPTRRATYAASVSLSSPVSPSSRSLDVMSNKRAHHRAVSRLKRRYCYLAATRHAAAFSDTSTGAVGSEKDKAGTISESELVAHVLLLQAEQMASKMTRSHHGLASPTYSHSPSENSFELSPSSLSISPIRMVPKPADRSAAKASPEQLAAIEKCLHEGDTMTSDAGRTDLDRSQIDSGTATATASAATAAPIPFLPAEDEMGGLSNEKRPTHFAPRFVFSDHNLLKLKEPLISENPEEGNDDEENEGGDTLSPLPLSSLAKSDRWAKHKKKGTKGRKPTSPLVGPLGSIINGSNNNLQANRPQMIPNQHFSIFQHNLVSMKQQEAKKKALREKKEQLIEVAQNKKMYDDFARLKAAATTKNGNAHTTNKAWLMEGRWFVDFDTFDTTSDEEEEHDDKQDPAIEAPKRHFYAASFIGGIRKQIIQHITK